MPLKKKSYSLENNFIEICSTVEIKHYKQSKITSENADEEIIKEVPKRKKNTFLGFFYMFLYVTNMALSSVIFKKLSYVSTGQLAFVRNVAAFAGSLPIAIACHENIFGKKKDWKVLIAGGLLVTSTLYLSIITYVLLPLADAAIILSIVPAVTILFARIYLQESCSASQSVSLVITLCGLLISARLPELLQERSDYQFDNNYISGIATAIACVIVQSITFVVLRKTEGIHFSIPTFYFGVFGMLENVIINGIMVSYSPIDCGWDQFLYICEGILGFVGMIVLTLALQVEEAGIMSVVKSSSEIIIISVCQIIFFKRYPDMYNVGGGFLVILSLSILGVRNWLLSLPENSEHRKKLRYFLI